ncbi:MAG: hypothetical protein IJE45_06260 [Bacilli bacterium]|nr:hypothetical protein [Bacilli bacterium]
MQARKRFFRLLSVLIILVAVLTVMVCSLLVTDTKTRYIKREHDEIIAHYTDLYCDNTGDGAVVALENGVGYVNFEIMNYIGEDVTKRDITYNIQTIDTFYNENGYEIESSALASAPALYVKDVWGKPQLIEKDSYKYDVSIIKNDGEKIEGANVEYPYLFSYEERKESAVGKVHNVTVKLTRTDSSEMKVGSTEKVSLVIQLEKPYKEVYIIDIVVSNRYIVFSTKNVEEFEIDMVDVHVQTYDIFKYDSLGNVNNGLTTNTKYSSRPFKVVFEWKDMIVNENDFNFIHNSQNGVMSGVFDSTTDGTDISKPFVESINQSKNYGSLTMYVPQSASFSFSCLPTSENACMIAKVYVYNDALATGTTSPIGYVAYDKNNWGGYSELDITQATLPSNATDGLTVVYKYEEEQE